MSEKPIMENYLSGFKVEVRRDTYHRGLDLYFFRQHPNSNIIEVVTGFQVQQFNQYEVEPKGDVPLKITKEQGQHLVDALWECGFKPSEGTGSAGSLAATQEHLADMRATGSKLWELVDFVVKK